MNKALIPKSDQAMPDYVTFRIYYVNGTNEEIKVGTYLWLDNHARLEIINHDDEYRWIIMANVIKIEMDKAFTKFVELANKQLEAKKKKG